MKIRIIAGMLTLILLAFVVSVSAEDAHWQVVIKDSAMHTDTYVKKGTVNDDGTINVQIKNVCRATDECWINILKEFCSSWTCDYSFVGDPNNGTPAQSEVKSCTIDCANKKYRLEKISWYAADGSVVAKAVVDVPGWDSALPEDVEGDVRTMMGMVVEEDDVIDFICRQ